MNAVHHLRLSALSRIRDADLALMQRAILTPSSNRYLRNAWLLLTHLGSSLFTITAAMLPMIPGTAAAEAVGIDAIAALASSHLVIQVMKRTVRRDRPALGSIIAAPDRFSFPSGHATAAMAIALAYGTAFPLWGALFIATAVLVGWSRVVLGVHYPLDVLAGQMIAAICVAAII